MYYEKAYKKALELARKGAKIEEIFPELNEPSGEKIRKTLIDAIGRSGEFISILKNNGIFYEDAIKWLNELNETEQKAALRVEYEKGRADVLRCIDPDEMVADFCSQPLSKTRSIASVYRQGILDILKRINNNEKTSITSARSIDDGGVR